MKELELHAWHKTEEKMYKVLAIDWQTGNISLIYDNQSDWEVTREKKTLDFERIESVELIQYINKKDIHGKEIYESDIVDGTYMFLDSKPRMQGVVKFDTESSAYVIEGISELKGTKIALAKLDDLEIVGNVHEGDGDKMKKEEI